VNTTSIHRASAEGDCEAILLSLDRGEDINCPDNNGNSPLHHAIRNSHRKATSLLLSRGASPDRLALRLAIYRGDKDLVLCLLGAGVDPNVSSSGDELTPLQLACGLLEDVTGHLLPFHGSNFGWLRDSPRSDGLEERKAFQNSRPASCAFGIAEALMHHGAGVNIPGYKGRFPLHAAALANNCELINLLLKRGADPAVPDCGGETARGRAVGAGRAESAKCLREFEAP